jgi:hypothetical protein
VAFIGVVGVEVAFIGVVGVEVTPLACPKFMQC